MDTSYIKIKSYKHNGQLHRMWHQNIILQQTNQSIIGINDQTKVTESDETEWVTKVPAIFYFYAQYWFNIIALIKEDGIHYYCNISSPYTINDEAIKYIDYDLDIEVQPDRSIHLLDEDEYLIHKQALNYPLELDKILAENVSRLYDWIENKRDPFSPSFIHYWYHEYLRMNKL